MRSLLSELGALPDEFPCCSLALGLPEGPLFPGRREHTGNQVTWLVGEEKIVEKCGNFFPGSASNPLKNENVLK